MGWVAFWFAMAVLAVLAVRQLQAEGHVPTVAQLRARWRHRHPRVKDGRVTRRGNDGDG